MFELAMRRSRGILAIFLMTACALAILVGQSLWLPEGAYAAPSEQAAPPMPHPVQGQEHCLTCHQPGGGLKPAPADHAGRPESSCTACHQAPAAQPASAAQPAATQPAGAQPTATPSAAGGQPAAAQPAGQPATAQPAAPAQGQAATTQAQPVQDPVAASAACRTCHNTPEFAMVSQASPVTAPSTQAGPQWEYAHQFIPCVTCHQGNPHSGNAVTKTSIAEACGRCHVHELADYSKSIHGQSLASGGKDAATCIDCHSTQGTPHSITRVLSTQSPTYPTSIAATCAKCHAKTEIMQKYGIPTDVYSTYMATFHGKDNVLSPYEITQHSRAATCIDCHGYHDIKSTSDPTSPVAKANLPTTCGRCHPGAGAEFAAGWLGHKEATPEQFPAVYFAERFFFVLTTTVLTFGFVFMVALELGSWIIRRRPTEH